MEPSHLTSLCGFFLAFVFCLSRDIRFTIYLTWQQEHPFVGISCGQALCLHAGIPALEGTQGCSQNRVFLSWASMALGRGMGRSRTQNEADQGPLPSGNFWNTPNLRLHAGRVLTCHPAEAPRSLRLDT